MTHSNCTKMLEYTLIKTLCPHTISPSIRTNSLSGSLLFSFPINRDQELTQNIKIKLTLSSNSKSWSSKDTDPHQQIQRKRRPKKKLLKTFVNYCNKMHCTTKRIRNCWSSQPCQARLRAARTATQSNLTTSQTNSWTVFWLNNNSRPQGSTSWRESIRRNSTRDRLVEISRMEWALTLLAGTILIKQCKLITWPTRRTLWFIKEVKARPNSSLSYQEKRTTRIQSRALKTRNRCKEDLKVNWYSQEGGNRNKWKGCRASRVTRDRNPI